MVPLVSQPLVLSSFPSLDLQKVFNIIKLLFNYSSETISTDSFSPVNPLEIYRSNSTIIGSFRIDVQGTIHFTYLIVTDSGTSHQKIVTVELSKNYVGGLDKEDIQKE